MENFNKKNEVEVKGSEQIENKKNLLNQETASIIEEVLSSNITEEKINNMSKEKQTVLKDKIFAAASILALAGIYVFANNAGAMEHISNSSEAMQGSAAAAGGFAAILVGGVTALARYIKSIPDTKKVNA